jgi:hypothetical protein
VPQPTATTPPQPPRAGLVVPTRIGQWTFYKRDERAIGSFRQRFGEEL